MTGQEWEPPVIGPLAQVCIALVALDLPKVSRSALRALLPTGTIRRRPNADQRGGKGPSVNRTSLAFGAALKRLENEGYLRRSAEYVEDINRPALARFVENTWSAAPPIPWEYAAALTALLRSDDDGQRDAEASAIRRLMQQAPTRPGGGRIVHRSFL